jgi:hypothetical protein
MGIFVVSPLFLYLIDFEGLNWLLTENRALKRLGFVLSVAGQGAPRGCPAPPFFCT